MTPPELPLERVSAPEDPRVGGRASTGRATPLVSVVIPFKDMASFVRETLDSVLAQTWTELDVVLVDDGGCDGSEAIAREVAAADPGRVRVVAHEGRGNLGTGPSRALGIRQARGELIAFLDADDVWEPTHLEDDVRLLLASPGADMVCGRAWSWCSWNASNAEDYLSDLAFAPGAVVPGTRLLTAVLRNGNLATPTCSLLVRRDVLLGCIDHLEAFPDLYEDQVINSWLQLRVRAVMSGGTGAWYRQHEASISARHARVSGNPAQTRLAFLTWLRSELAASAPRDQELAAVAETALWQAQDRVTAGRRHGVRGVLRALVRPAVRRWPVGRWVRASLVPLSAQARRARIERLLYRTAADIRGDVLLLGDAAEHLRPGAGVTAVTTLRSSLTPDSHGPHHALSRLPSLSYDCVVLVADAWTGGPDVLGLRHLHRALRPAGVLLLVLRGGDRATGQVLREVFGRDAVSIDEQHWPGPPARPLVCLRAATPAA